MTPEPVPETLNCLTCKKPMTTQETNAYGRRCEDCFAWAGRGLSHAAAPGVYNADARKDGRAVKKGTGD